MRQFLLLLVLWAAAVFTPAAAAETAALIEIDGPVGPATSGYFVKARQQALDDGVAFIILRIDTPGGLDTAMRDIIKAILDSPVPVVAWVAPGGARAASAGTFFVYAAHIAAMAPATNVGAATPVPVLGAFPGDEDRRKPARDERRKDKDRDEDEAEEKAPPRRSGDAMEHKVINDAVAYLRSLAAQRGRNADWAEKAVREGASLPADEALKLKVIDVVAADVPELLKKLHGRSVQTAAGRITLQTEGVAVNRYAPDWRFRLLAVLTNPTVAYILMLVGIYGLLLEGYHPGAILPGVAGAICLLLALFAFQVLPVNFAGLALMLLGVLLMIGEALNPSVGALGIGGVISFVFGSILLMDIDVPGYGVNLGVIGGIAAGASAVLGLTLFLLYRARRAPQTTGRARALGQVVEITEFAGGRGWARLGGEHWRVQSTAALVPGQRARVTAVDGLTLTVEPE